MADTDIVTRLRNPLYQLPGDCIEASNEIERLRKEVADAYSKSAQVLADLSANLCTASALERERLTAERDEARRECCLTWESVMGREAQTVAEDKGWDCFKENTND